MEEVRDTACTLALEFARAKGLHVGRHLLERRAESRQRRGAHDLDLAEGNDGWPLCVARRARDDAAEQQRRTPHQRMATPHGSSPTGISAVFALVSVSITATALDRPHAT